MESKKQKWPIRVSAKLPGCCLLSGPLLNDGSSLSPCSDSLAYAVPTANRWRVSQGSCVLPRRQTVFSGFQSCRRRRKPWNIPSERASASRYIAIARPRRTSLCRSQSTGSALQRPRQGRQTKNLPRGSVFRTRRPVRPSRAVTVRRITHVTRTQITVKGNFRKTRNIFHPRIDAVVRTDYYLASSPLEPFTPGAEDVRLFVSRLRGRAVRRASHDSLSLGRFRLWWAFRCAGVR